MKKFFTIFLTAVMAISAANAQDMDMKEFRRTIRQRKMEARLSSHELNQRSNKYAVKEAKRLTKEGWVVAAGILPLEKQLDKAYHMQYEYDENGFPKFILGQAMAFGGAYDAAKMQAVNNAKVELAGLIETEVTALTESTVANSEMSPNVAASINEAVQATKSLIAQKIGRVVVVSETYKKTKKGYQVQVLIGYNAKMAMDYAKEIVKKRLEEKGEQLHDELDRMWGSLEN